MAFDSEIGYAVGEIFDPEPGGDSIIGYAVGILRNPHYPVGTKTASGVIKWGPSLVLADDGLR